MELIETNRKSNWKKSKLLFIIKPSNKSISHQFIFKQLIVKVMEKSKLENTLAAFLADNNGPQILEISTEQSLNAQVLKDFFNFVKK